ncbi:unnamed protein product [Closterium sp. Yama58-4]|nr:unnamed protein product [Closterium sp. Yama58-4]
MAALTVRRSLAYPSRLALLKAFHASFDLITIRESAFIPEPFSPRRLSSRSGRMASSRLSLLLPLLLALALALALAPSLSTHGSALARSISASDVSDGDIDRSVTATASSEGDSTAVAVPGAEEHVRRSLQSQKVSCDQNSILPTYRVISDLGNGTKVIQLIIKNLCPYDVIGRLIFWNCQMDTIFAAGNTNFQTGKLLFNKCCKARGQFFCELAINTTDGGVQLRAGKEFKVLYSGTRITHPCVQQIMFKNQDRYYLDVNKWPYECYSYGV